MPFSGPLNQPLNSGSLGLKDADQELCTFTAKVDTGDGNQKSGEV